MARKIVAKLEAILSFVSSDNLIMVGREWLWLVGVKLWLVVGGGGKIVTGSEWQRRIYVWSWVVVGGGGKIMAGRERSWLFVAGRTI